jgi:hypothetical protein
MPDLRNPTYFENKNANAEYKRGIDAAQAVVVGIDPTDPDYEKNIVYFYHLAVGYTDRSDLFREAVDDFLSVLITNWKAHSEISGG